MNKLLVLLTILCVIIGCNTSKDGNELIPSLNGEITTSVDEIVLSDVGESKTFVLRTQGEWSIELSDTKASTDWLTISHNNGFETYMEIIVSALTANENETDRCAYLKIKSGKFFHILTVTQKRKGALLLAQNHYDIDHKGGSITVELKSDTDYDIFIPLDATWVSKVETKSIGTFHHTFSISENKGYDKRDAHIIFKDKNSSAKDTLSISQSTGLERGIFTAEDFQRLADELISGRGNYEVLNKCGTLSNGRWSFELKSDIDLNPGITFNPDGTYSGGTPKEWKPIGYNINDEDKISEFNGTFIGNGHKISGLYIKQPYRNNQGLFSKIGSKGEIIDLHVISGSINVNSIAGAICGYNSGKIEKCSAALNITVAKGTAGGVVAVNKGIIVNSVHSGTIEGIGASTLGGICGSNYGKDSKVTDCSNSGMVDAQRNGSAGGICGASSGIISGCTNAGGDIYAYSVGGICGKIDEGEVSNCINNADLDEDLVGGICGTTDSGIIVNCVNNGNIHGKSYCAGISAKAYDDAVIMGCYNTGRIAVNSQSGAAIIGGIVGKSDNGEHIASCVYIACYNTGVIGERETSSYACSGGIAGLGSSLIFVSCYNVGEKIRGGSDGSICGSSGKISNEFNWCVGLENAGATALGLGTIIGGGMFSKDQLQHASADFNKAIDDWNKLNTSRPAKICNYEFYDSPGDYPKLREKGK